MTWDEADEKPGIKDEEQHITDCVRAKMCGFKNKCKSVSERDRRGRQEQGQRRRRPPAVVTYSLCLGDEERTKGYSGGGSRGRGVGPVSSKIARQPDSKE